MNNKKNNRKLFVVDNYPNGLALCYKGFNTKTEALAYAKGDKSKVIKLGAICPYIVRDPKGDKE